MSNIAMQVEQTSVGSVNDEGAVLFNSIVFSTGDISYNPATGVVSINEPGRYVVHWWAATQSASPGNGPTFAVTATSGDVVIGNSPIKTGEVSGNAVIESDDTFSFQLVNQSDSTVYFSTLLPVKASLLIVQDDESSASGGGAVVPFASGTPIQVTTILGGLAGLPATVAFGNSMQIPTVLGVSLDLVGLDNMAFMMPRNGIITAISTFFSVTLGLSLLGSTVTVTTQLYQSLPASDTFVAIPGALASFSLAGTISIGDTFTDTVTGLNIAVDEGTRLLLVVSATATGLSVVNTVIGQLSAGVAMA